jgi:hypothetical protein
VIFFKKNFTFSGGTTILNKPKPATMRKIVVFAALCIAVVAAMYTTACNNGKKEPQANTKEDSVKNMIARGEYLANVSSPIFRATHN